MRVVFMGSPAFAVPTLRAVAEAHEIVGVVSQPDKPAGRGQKVVAPAVKEWADSAGMPVFQPKSARTEEFLATLRELRPDVAVVVAYGKILPQTVLDVPRHGCLNVHASLLPRHRGAAPIQWSIISGDTETGITIMRLDAGMDTGPMLLSRSVKIGADETAGELALRLAPMGAELMRVALERLGAGALVETPQDGAQATAAPPLAKEHGRIDWKRPARELHQLIRGVDPWPAATARLGDDMLKVWKPRLVDGIGPPGTVLGAGEGGLVVASGSGALALGELQLPGKKRMPAAALLSGRAIPAGTVLS